MSDSDWIFQDVALGIRALVEKFIELPFFFYSEQDMHAYLYHKLISGRLGEFMGETCFGDKTVLLHKEYPTLGKYPEARGHFDLVIIDPERISKSHWRMRIKPPPYSRHTQSLRSSSVSTQLELCFSGSDTNEIFPVS